MSKKVNSIVSGGGLFLGIMTDLTSAIRDAGGTDEDIYRLARPEGRLTIREMAKLVARKPVVDGYPVTIDYGQTIEQMIANGRYDWKNGDIAAEHFPLPSTGQNPVTLELIHFDRVISTNDALKEIDARGYRPATIAELLAFGAGEQTKELQRQFPIIALGSVWRRLDGRRSVAYLDGHASLRRLRLNWFEDDWREFCRFLVVRK